MAAPSVYPGEIFLQEGFNADAPLNGYHEQSSGEVLDEMFSPEDDGDSPGVASRQRISRVHDLPQGSDYPATALLNDLRTIARNLRMANRQGGASEAEFYNQQENPAIAGPIIAGLSLGFTVLSSAVATLRHGDLQVTMPTSEVGVTATNLPAGVRLNTKTINNRVVFYYRKANPTTDLEQVNIQLTCTVQYNGPEVKATFGFAPDGARARLLRDATVNIRNPLNLQTMRTSADWVRAGIPEYPVVIVPVEVRVDHPWPQSNANFSFNLVLSGMYGLGRTATSGYRENYIRRDN